MKKNSFQNKVFISRVLMVAAVVMCMITAVYFCMQKKGFHEDEYYSFYSTCRTAGFWIEDETWMDRQDYWNEYVVLPNEGFRYDFVKQVQSWDVHPPFYYWVLHTICSIGEGHFSMWFGLGINLVCFAVSLGLLGMVVKALLEQTKGQAIPTEERNGIAVVVILLYGMSAAALSGVTFIRMYVMLTCFVLWLTLLHIKNMKSTKLSFLGFLLPLGICTYLGFLTQYYFFIYLFFLAFFFFCYKVFKREFANGILYGITLVVALLLGYLTYPSCLGQMFKGQRGGQAVGNFFDLSNTWDRFVFFADLYNQYVWDGFFWLFASVLLIGAIILTIKKVRKDHPLALKSLVEGYEVIWLLVLTLCGYYLAVSKTALLLGATSLRYQLPVYGVALALMVIGFYGLLWAFSKGHSKASVKRWCGMALLMIVMLFSHIYSYSQDRVQFLYPEDEKQVLFARAHADTPVVYAYEPSQTWCVWDSTNELLEYPSVYFLDQSKDTLLQDEMLLSAQELVVYISNLNAPEATIERILASNGSLTTWEKQYDDKFCSVYIIK